MVEEGGSAEEMDMESMAVEELATSLHATAYSPARQDVLDNRSMCLEVTVLNQQPLLPMTAQAPLQAQNRSTAKVGWHTSSWCANAKMEIGALQCKH